MTANQRLRKRLLRGHARTFSLTLGLLPSWLRDPLGLAYLLARASDTVADASGIPHARRLVLMEELKRALDTEAPSLWKPVFLPGELSASEEELMAALPELLADLATHPDRMELLALWRTILEGQLFDQRRFPSQDPLTREELERYCGLVAGSVGETWTRLIEKHAPYLLRGELGEMCRLGADYGRGLQLVNILRDRAADRGIGRVYASDAELPALWDLASGWLDRGERYLSLLRPGRVLYASALPCALGIGTLGKIRNAPDGENGGRVSLTRREVYAELVRNAPSLCFPR
ncbi:MAG: squalene/phytoene synthase family protein [Candidatus Taylorbacteria bacterium]